MMDPVWCILFLLQKNTEYMNVCGLSLSTIPEVSMKKSLCLVFSLFILAVALSTHAEKPGRTLTLMIYMCGSNLESTYGSATNDIEEIQKACAGNNNLSVLILLGGSNKWKKNYDPDMLHLIEVGSRGSRVLRSMPEMNMGDAEPLSILLQLGPELLPAENYALILWDHGGGPLEGICLDERNEMDSLTLIEIEKAFEDSPFTPENHLSWIGFDACLMSSLETAHVCSRYADYMIASQETEPNTGWNYSFLETIGVDYQAEETGREIVNTYMEGKEETDMLTLALIQLDKITAVEDVADAFFRSIGSKLTAVTFPSLSRSRFGTKNFGRISTGSDYDLIDLFNFSEQFSSASPGEAASLQSALSVAVICTTGNQEDAHGLSIFFPYYNKEMYTNHWASDYARFNMLPSYHQFLSRYSNLWTKKQNIDWFGLSGRAGELTAQRTQSVEISLTEDQAANYVTASCQILQDAGSDRIFRSIYIIEDLPLHGDTVSAEYSFEALYAVDENGKVLTDQIPFIEMGGYYNIYASLGKYSFLYGEETPEPDEKLDVCVQCRRNDETGELKIVNVFPMASQGLTYGREATTLDPAQWNYVAFMDIPRSVSYSDDGRILPYQDWEREKVYDLSINVIDGNGNQVSDFGQIDNLKATMAIPLDYHLTTEVWNHISWNFRFLPLKTSGKNIVAQFIIRDAQGNRWGSDLIALNNPDVKSSVPIAYDPYCFDDCEIQPVEIKLLTTDQFKGICLRFRVNNHGAKPHTLCFMMPIVNNYSITSGLVCGTTIVTERLINPGEECYSDLYLDLSNCLMEGDFVIHSISLIPTFLDADLWLTHRIYINTELAISPTMFSIQPNPILQSYYIQDDLSYRLMTLESDENRLLHGNVAVYNANSFPVRLIPFKEAQDDSYACIISDQVVRNCLDMPAIIDLVPGGSCSFEFSVYPDAYCNLWIDTGYKEYREQIVSNLDQCGFLFALYDNIDSFDKDDDSVSKEITPVIFSLSQPLTFNEPINLISQPVELQQFGLTTSVKTGEMGNSLPVFSTPESTNDSTKDENPYPFFKEFVDLPANPESYGVTFVCPVSDEETENISQMSIWLVSPNPYNKNIYDLLAVLFNEPYLEGSTVAMDFFGLLPALLYSDQSFPCMVEESTGIVDIDLLCNIYLSGIHNVQPGMENQLVRDIHLEYTVDSHQALFTRYTVKPFRPNGDQMDEVVVFYHSPYLIQPGTDGASVVIEPLDDNPEFNEIEAHHFSGAPDIRLLPVENLKPDVIFMITYDDGKVSMIRLPWLQAVQN